jgi:hypothetical protein
MGQLVSDRLMTRIVTSRYRYRPLPRRKKAVALEVPAIVTIDRKTRRRKSDATKAASVESTPANDDRKPAAITATPPKSAPSGPIAARPSAIVTARKPGKRYRDVPEVSEEEHRRVGDLADALMLEFKRVIAEKTRGEKT